MRNIKRIFIFFLFITSFSLLSGCSLEDIFVKDYSGIYTFRHKGDVGKNVEICNAKIQDCIVSEKPQDALYGLVRGGKFEQGKSGICYPLIESCLEAPEGPTLKNGEISLWKFNGENAENGPLIGKLVIDDQGYWHMSPVPGIYWITYYDKNNAFPVIDGYEKVFGGNKFHYIGIIEVKQDSSLSYSIYVKK